MDTDFRSIYAQAPATLPPIEKLKLSFYHAVDLPEGITTPGKWDLRGRVDDYLGHVDFAGKRVLEIGPASGFLTMEMERRGADVVALEIAEHLNWDFVPFPDEVMTGIREHRLRDLRYLRNTFWYTHRAFGLRAKVVHGDASAIPSELGRFDVAVLGAVLLHVGEPHRVLEQCTRIADTIVVTDLHYPDLDNCGPILRFHPTTENRDWSLWWHLTPAFVARFMSVAGFDAKPPMFHEQHHVVSGRDARFFTVVADAPI